VIPSELTRVISAFTSRSLVLLRRYGLCGSAFRRNGVTFAVLFMKAIRRIPEPLFYGLLFVISTTCFLFLGNRLSRFSGPVSVNAELNKPDDPKQAANGEAESPLVDRMTALAKNIFLFLRERGQEDPPSLSYIVKVHDGFMLLWFPKVEAITYEPGFVGIVDFTLGELMRKHQELWSYDSIKQVAETLLAVKNKMELNSYKALTLTQREVDQMSSTEMRRRIETDPDFSKQVLRHALRTPRTAQGNGCRVPI
jgi:hypothetical protein